MDIRDCYINLPGRIVGYNASNQTATVRICVERGYDSSEQLSVQKARGILFEVPVHTSYGGGWSLTHPIKAGDTCILFFSQTGYDHWLHEDKDVAGTFKNQPMFWTKRVLDVSDCYALVGLNTIPRAIADYHDTDSEWRNVDRDQRIALKEDGHIHIKTGSTTIDLAASGDIKIYTDTEVEVTAGESVHVVSPEVTVDCDDAIINATANVDVNAGAMANVISPIATITATTSVTATTPLFSIDGNLLVSGGFAAGVPVGTPVAAGSAMVGPVAVTGDMALTGASTAADFVTVGGISLNTHVHTALGAPPS